MRGNANDINPYQSERYLSGESSFALDMSVERLQFIRRTYAHLAMAVAGFIAIETILLMLIPAPMILGLLRMGGGLSWLVVLGAFMLVSWIANTWAQGHQSRGLQYAGLTLYVVAEAVIFLPLLFVAANFMGGTVIPAAGLITAMAFGGLTAAVLFTRADLRWIGKFLWIASFAALGIIICGLLFGFNLGVFFSGFMVAVAAGYIAYDTSNVLHHYDTNQHVAAALALFASVALLFWYVLRLVMAFSSQD